MRRRDFTRFPAFGARARQGSAPGVLALTAGLLAVGAPGCSDDDSSGGNRMGPDGGVAGSAGAGASGGTSGGSGGGGAGGSGTGAGGMGGTTGGTAGSGGSSPDASTGCPAPGDATSATVCVSIVPETVTFESDPNFDGSGVFALEVFDVASPPDDPLAELSDALYTLLLPVDAQTGGEIALAEIPPIEVSLPNAPTTVYMRAIFFDNPDAFAGTGLVAGTWIGGLDFTGGFVENQPLAPVSITPGAGTDVSLDLFALRQLTVTVDASAAPVGDGEGPLLLLATDSSDLAGDPPVFGFASVPCVDLQDLPDAFVVPTLGLAQTLYVTGLHNDLGLPGDFPPGALAAVDVNLDAGTGSIPASVSIGTDYTPEVSIDLSFVNPWPADAGAVPANACTDILLSDGGLP